MKTGYCITTRRFTLRCKHPEWFHITQELYNQVVEFYYRLLLDYPKLHALNNQQILRELEILSIPGREKNAVPHPLVIDSGNRIPLYFRRAAINAASAMVKSYLNREGFTNQASDIEASVVYYKGMYRDFTEESITLKVYDGTAWQWMKCRLSGNQLPDSLEIMSPTVVIAGNTISLHVPVKEEVSDARTSKERMKAGENICSIQFTNSDAFAAACILDSQGHQLAVRFFKGGKEYRHHCTLLLKQIEKSESSRRKPDESGTYQKDNPLHEKTNQKYWIHLKNLSDHYAHQVSSRIIAFCQEKDAKAIVMGDSNSADTAAVMKSAGNWSPLHLSTRIRENLSYKAWKAGIVVLEVIPDQKLSVCSVCGAEITRHGEMYECANGHKGNRYLNLAKNLGRICLEDYRKKERKRQ